MANQQSLHVFTIGYQSHTLESMVGLLESNRVQLLIDVRQNPISRKKGFSGRQLKESVRKSGIAYLHIPELGTPASIRKAYAATGNIDRALNQYEIYLRRRPNTLKTLLLQAQSKSFCLLCLEANHKACHRSIITQLLTEMTGCRPIHLH